MHLLNKLIHVLEWQELAAIVAVITALVSGTFAISKQVYKHTKTLQLIAASNSIKERHEISKEIQIEHDKAKLFFVTFCKNDQERSTFDEHWIIDKTKSIPVIKNSYFVVKKKTIQDNMKDPLFPCKFYLEVDNTPQEKQKYYTRLLEAECTVTGKGSIDVDNSSKWRIWFLVNNEPYHPDIEDLMRINHTLVNRALVREGNVSRNNLVKGNFLG